MILKIQYHIHFKNTYKSLFKFSKTDRNHITWWDIYVCQLGFICFFRFCSQFLLSKSIFCYFQVLAEASKKVFSSVKSKIVDFIIDQNDLINNSATEKKRSDKCPEWIKVLEPIRKQPTNVGAKIRNRVKKSLERGPPEWATEMLLKSISKDIYKGNAAGPTKVRALTSCFENLLTFFLGSSFALLFYEWADLVGFYTCRVVDKGVELLLV